MTRAKDQVSGLYIRNLLPAVGKSSTRPTVTYIVPSEPNAHTRRYLDNSIAMETFTKSNKCTELTHRKLGEVAMLPAECNGASGKRQRMKPLSVCLAGFSVVHNHYLHQIDLCHGSMDVRVCDRKKLTSLYASRWVTIDDVFVSLTQ